MYKMLAVDLDGTLLNSQKQISDENIKAVQYARDKGIKVIICSGRIYKGARVFAKQLDLEEILIACNGAIARDVKTGQMIFSKPLKKEDCHRIIDICHEEGIYFHSYIGDTMYTEKLAYTSMFYLKKNEELNKEDRIDIKIVKDLNKIIINSHQETTKFVVISDEQEFLQRVRNRIGRIDTLSIMSSNSDNFEIVSKGVGKGNALEYIAYLNNIKKEEVVAIGDNENDISMLEYAGLGIAMGNAPDFVKEVADIITLTNDQDGFSKAIRKVL